MTELQRLLAACDEQLKQGRQCALATVVQVEGSAYRRPGARMLITDAGQLTGTISGGCLEGDARRRALRVMQSKKPEIVIYDSLDLDDDLEHGAQLGCQGLIHVLIEPLSNEKNHTIELLHAAVKQDKPVVLVTILKGFTDNYQTGAAFLITTDGYVGDVPKDLQEALLPGAEALLQEDYSGIKEISIGSNELVLFYETIKPAPSLTIYGAGNDVQPLVKMAVNMGWLVTVVDGRANLVTAGRFPRVQQVECVKVADLKKHEVDSNFAVLMSHNYIYDLEVLKNLYNKPHVNYIGLLGPRKKTDRMLEDLRIAGFAITDEFTSRLFGPVGINIGAEAAEEIALAIMAELVAVKNGHPAGFLRDLDGPIHNNADKIPYHAQ